jgi:DNA polymerase I
MDSLAQEVPRTTTPSISRTSPARAPSSSPSIRSRWSRPAPTPPRTPTSRCGCTARCGRRSRRRRPWPPCTETSRCRWCRCSRSMERTGVRIDAELLRAQSADLASAPWSWRSGLRQRRAQVQPRLAQADRRHLLRRAEAAGGGQDAQGPAVHVRGRAGAARRRRLRAAAAHRRAPRLTKLRSTYTDKLPALINAATGRVHTSYHQAVAATGRLSSSDPNLQNIPIRSEGPAHPPRLHPAEPGLSLLAADYSQIELRIMAHLSGDARLRAAFAAGQDIHRATAAEIHGWRSTPSPPSSAAAPRPSTSGSSTACPRSARAPARHRARRRAGIRGPLLRPLPGVREFMDASAPKPAPTATSRPCSAAGSTCRTSTTATASAASAAERTAINAPMQGTAADIIKRAMIAWTTGCAPSSRRCA